MAPPSVIIIEQDRETLETLETKLQSLGCHVQCYSSGRQGLEQLVASPPDMVILAVSLPRTSGYKICKKLKGHSRYRKIPLFMMGDLSDQSTFEQHQKRTTRADEYFYKPLEIERVLAQVRAHLGDKLASLLPEDSPSIEIEMPHEGILGGESMDFSMNLSLGEGEENSADYAMPASEEEMFGDASLDSPIEASIVETPNPASAPEPLPGQGNPRSFFASAAFDKPTATAVAAPPPVAPTDSTTGFGTFNEQRDSTRVVTPPPELLSHITREAALPQGTDSLDGAPSLAPPPRNYASGEFNANTASEKELRARLARREDQLAQQRTLYDTALDERAQAQELLAQARHEALDHQQKLTRQDLELTRLRGSLDLMQEQQHDQGSALMALQTRLEAVTQEAAEAARVRDEALQALHQAHQQQEQADSALAKFQEENQTLLEKQVLLEQEKAGLTQDNAGLQEHLQQAQQEFQIFQQKTQDELITSQELARLTLDNQEQQTVQLHTELEGMRVALAQSQSQLHELQTEHDTLQTQASSLEKQDQQVLALEQKLVHAQDALHNTREHLRAVIAKAEADMNQAREAHGLARQQWEQEKAVMAEEQRRLSDLVKDLEERAENFEAQASQTRDALEILSQEHQTLETNFATSEQAAADLKEELRQTQQELAELRLSREALQRQLQRHEELAQTSQQHNNQQQTQLQFVVERQEERLQGLTQALLTLESAHQISQENLGHTEDWALQLQERLEQSAQAFTDLAKALAGQATSMEIPQAPALTELPALTPVADLLNAIPAPIDPPEIMESVTTAVAVLERPEIVATREDLAGEDVDVEMELEGDLEGDLRGDDPHNRQTFDGAAISQDDELVEDEEEFHEDLVNSLADGLRDDSPAEEGDLELHVGQGSPSLEESLADMGDPSGADIVPSVDVSIEEIPDNPSDVEDIEDVKGAKDAEDAPDTFEAQDLPEPVAKPRLTSQSSAYYDPEEDDEDDDDEEDLFAQPASSPSQPEPAPTETETKALGEDPLSDLVTELVDDLSPQEEEEDVFSLQESDDPTYMHEEDIDADVDERGFSEEMSALVDDDDELQVIVSDDEFDLELEDEFLTDEVQIEDENLSRS